MEEFKEALEVISRVDDTLRISIAIGLFIISMIIFYVFINNLDKDDGMEVEEESATFFISGKAFVLAIGAVLIAVITNGISFLVAFPFAEGNVLKSAIVMHGEDENGVQVEEYGRVRDGDLDGGYIELGNGDRVRVVEEVGGCEKDMYMKMSDGRVIVCEDGIGG